VRANPGTSAKAIHERLSKVRPMHATSPNIWLGVLMDHGLVRREKGFRRSFGYWVRDASVTSMIHPSHPQAVPSRMRKNQKCSIFL
jgi:hypothetical protein